MMKPSLRIAIQMICLIFASLITVPPSSFGKTQGPQKSRNDQSSLPSNFTIRVETVHGERTGSILVSGKGSDAKISLETNAGDKAERKLSKREVEYILKSLKSLPANKSIPDDCYRSRIEIQTEGLASGPKSLKSCFGVTTKTSQAYARFTRILTAAF